jgi:hypothetical protein
MAAKSRLAYPNPVENVIYFRESVKFYQLKAINGQILKQGNNVMEFGVKDLVKGLYILEYQTKEGLWQHQTMIKE